MALGLAAAALVAALFSSAAAAATTVCAPGSGAGQCSNPGGVASDFEYESGVGRLYVADRNNNRVDVFEVQLPGGDVAFVEAWGWDVIPGGGTGFEKCTAVTGCKAGIAGNGEGQLDDPRRVAVDNDLGGLGSEGHHAVYVYESANKRVQGFEADGEPGGRIEGFSSNPALIAVGSEGTLYVGDTLGGEVEARIKTYNPKLEPVGECEPAHDDRLNGALAVSSAGEIYAKFNKGGGIFRFNWGEPVCEESGAQIPEGAETTALGVDGAGNLHAGQRALRAKGGSYRMVARYDPAGNLSRRYGYGELSDEPVQGVAALATAGGDLFAAQRNGAVKYLSEPGAGPVIANLQAGAANVNATLEAEINPEGKATSYRFEYLSEQAYQEQGESFLGPGTKSAEGSLGEEAADFALHLASAPVGCKDPIGEEELCLVPETTYRYRVVAENADGKGNSAVEGSFETKEALEITEVFASEVGPDSARFWATVNTLGIPASGYFEYEVPGSGEAVRVPPSGSVEFGSAEGVSRSAVTGTLLPGREYRLRFKATNVLLEGAELTGEAQPLFATPRLSEIEDCPQNQAFRGAAGAYLPDCRAYELVSPLEKAGGDIVTLNEELYLLPAVLNQSSAAGERLAYGTYRAFGDAEAAPYTAQYIASRGAGEWSSHYILGPREELNVKASLSAESELKALSPDLCQGWFKSVAEPPLAAKAVAGQANLYRRSDGECGEEAYEALSTVEPSDGGLGKTELQGSSADGGKAIYATLAKLSADAPDLKGEAFSLYFQEEGEGPPRYVCRGTDGLAMAISCSAGGPLVDVTAKGRSASLHNAISADGERVFFSAPATGAGAGKIYLREHPGEPQSGVAGEECTQPTRGCTTAVSREAEEIEGTTSSQYWWAAADGSRAIFTTGGTLYEFEVDSATTTPIAAGAVGVMGASEDAERVYFASTLDLGTGPNPVGDSPQAGKPNLYLAEGGEAAAFVGSLAVGTDTAETSDYAVITTRPQKRTARVSPDGLHAAFTSSARLTHYDNTDAKSGAQDLEVFRYGATGGGELLCVSCNPSGGRPVGGVLPKGAVPAAGTIPVWFKALYPGRMLAPDGSRLYFEAADALVPRDANGTTDVYQWEEPGMGGCDEEDADFSAKNGGCVSLISSGQSSGEAHILDASQSGEDVFFTTAASLVGWDYGLIDIYDARVDGGLAGPPAPAGECEGEACQNPAPAPQARPPASLQYQGPGNLAQAKKKKKARRCPKGKRKVKRKGKVRCVKKKSAKRRHRLHTRRVRAARGWRG